MLRTLCLLPLLVLVGCSNASKTAVRFLEDGGMAFSAIEIKISNIGTVTYSDSSSPHLVIGQLNRSLLGKILGAAATVQTVTLDDSDATCLGGDVDAHVYLVDAKGNEVLIGSTLQGRTPADVNCTNIKKPTNSDVLLDIFSATSMLRETAGRLPTLFDLPINPLPGT